MVTGDFSELWDSDYYVLDEKTKEYILLDGAPPDIVELFKKERVANTSLALRPRFFR
jgi:hypothetical protein